MENLIAHLLETRKLFTPRSRFLATLLDPKLNKALMISTKYQ
jgi:hypothetical protein